MHPTENSAPVATLCAGAIVVDSAGRLLAVLRRNDPSRGCWSVPGGRVDPGENLASAARREVLEETGLHIEVGNYLGMTTQPYVDAGRAQRVLEIHDFAATVTGGTLTAGDDAADARWLSLAELTARELTPDLLAIISGFGVVLR